MPGRVGKRNQIGDHRWLAQYEDERMRNYDGQNHTLVSSKFDLTGLSWSEIRDLETDLVDQNDEPMTFGRALEALRKSWRSFKLNRKNGSPSPDLCLRILKLQNGLGLPLSQFEELEKYGGSRWALQELENQESTSDEEEVILRREERDSMLESLGVNDDDSEHLDSSEWSDWSGSDDLNGEELSKQLKREEFKDQLNAWGLDDEEF
jgi:hypothetical protein